MLTANIGQNTSLLMLQKREMESCKSNSCQHAEEYMVHKVNSCLLTL